MNKREIKICGAILKALNEADGQVQEVIIHAAVNQIAGEHVPLAELNAMIRLCDKEGWLTGVKTKFRGQLWNINDAGRAALLEMS